MRNTIEKTSVFGVLVNSYRLSKGKMREVAVEKDALPAITLEMYLWWFRNITTSFRYRMWHPNDHISFSREIPLNGDFDNEQNVLAELKFGNYNPSILHISKKVIKSISKENTLRYSINSSILDSNLNDLACINSKLREIKTGLEIEFKFILPSDTPINFINSMKKHIREENTHLVEFLPTFYKENIKREELFKFEKITGKYFIREL